MFGRNDRAMTPTSYVRRLTLFDTVMVVISGIIGAGIFLNPAVVAQRVHTTMFIVITWIVGGCIAFAGALCYAELGARRPQAGGGYVYLREIVGPMPAFLYGWTFLLVVNTGAIAALAVVFARYLVEVLGISHATAPAVVPGIAITAIVLLSALNYFGIKIGALTLNILTVLKLVALAALIVIGIAGVRAVSHTELTPPIDTNAPVSWWQNVRLLGIGLIPAIFSYGGWHHVNNVAAEVTSPQRTIPRALVLGMLAVVGVYLLVNVAYLRVLGPLGLAASLAPASDTVRAVVGPNGALVIGIGIVISTLGCAHITIVSAPRMLQRMAEDGLFFKSVAELHPRYRTPHRALFIQALWATVLVLSGTYGQLLDYVTFGDWLFIALIAAMVFAYHKRDANGAERTEGYRVAGYPVVPAVFILAAVFIVASVVMSAPRNALYGAVLIAIGVPAFALWRLAAPTTASTREATSL